MLQGRGRRRDRRRRRRSDARGTHRGRKEVELSRFSLLLSNKGKRKKKMIHFLRRQRRERKSMNSTSKNARAWLRARLLRLTSLRPEVLVDVSFPPALASGFTGRAIVHCSVLEKTNTDFNRTHLFSSSSFRALLSFSFILQEIESKRFWAAIKATTKGRERERWCVEGECAIFSGRKAKKIKI